MTESAEVDLPLLVVLLLIYFRLQFGLDPLNVVVCWLI